MAPSSGRLTALSPAVARLGEAMIAGFLVLAAASLLLVEFESVRVDVAFHGPFVALLFLAASVAAFATWHRVRLAASSEAVMIFLAFAALAGIYTPHVLLEANAGADPAHLIFGPASRAAFGVLLFLAVLRVPLPRTLRTPTAALVMAAGIVVGADLWLHSAVFREQLLADPIPVLRGFEWVAVAAQSASVVALLMRIRQGAGLFLKAIFRVTGLLLVSSLLFLDSSPWMLRWWVAHLGLMVSATVIVGAVLVGRARSGTLASVVDVDVLSSVADLLVEEMTVGLALVDRRGDLVGWNPAAAALTGWDHRTAQVRFPRAPIDGIIELGDATVRVRQSVVDRSKPLQVSFLEDASREALLTTENERLDRLSAERASAVEAKNAMVGMVSHELRGPLGVLSGFASLLSTRIGGDLGEQDRHILGRVEAVARSTEAIVDELVTVSALGDPASAPLELAAVDLRPLVAMVVAEQAKPAADKGIEVLASLPDEAIVAAVEEARIHQILTNLVTNALKFSEAATTVHVTARRVGSDSVLEVRDEGPGIPESEQAGIFELFQRSSVRPTAGEGSTGLGLAIVERLVEAHGGRIELDSTVGVGSTFRVVLPAV